MRTASSAHKRRNCPAPSDGLHFGPFSVAGQLRLEVMPQARHCAERGSGKEKGQESTLAKPRNCPTIGDHLSDANPNFNPNWIRNIYQTP